MRLLSTFISVWINSYKKIRRHTIVPNKCVGWNKRVAGKKTTIERMLVVGKIYKLKR